jgi:hypothetical protein
LILEEAEKLYNELITELTNRTMAATAAMKTISLPLPLSSSNKSQKLNYENDTYQTEETTCNNNQPQIYNGNQEQANNSNSYCQQNCSLFYKYSKSIRC